MVACTGSTFRKEGRPLFCLWGQWRCRGTYLTPALLQPSPVLPSTPPLCFPSHIPFAPLRSLIHPCTPCPLPAGCGTCARCWAAARAAATARAPPRSRRSSSRSCASAATATSATLWGSPSRRTATSRAARRTTRVSPGVGMCGWGAGGGVGLGMRVGGFALGACGRGPVQCQRKCAWTGGWGVRRGAGMGWVFWQGNGEGSPHTPT